ncbi:LuxR family transcriptional regulator [Pseudomonas sp. TCU-HL1]|uniref:LuxR family transcriptional regulator n=1 Tax=Pseudomonas sp. TCU-HL1 TaxID=1856685 RepID=UPI00085574B3|nr:LuxR family transcriptional regulator [Pseudomonas sp. TCU-HL1]AOE84327.1 LuxR family transcriptional regulator [Pseudomonas sp. TCU-HL1]
MDEHEFSRWRFCLERDISLVCSEEEMCFCLRGAFLDFGFDRFSCVISHVVPFVDRCILDFGDFPQGWADIFLKGNLVLHDPVVGLCARNSGVVAWRGKDICSSKSVLEVLARSGISSGLSCLVFPMKSVGGILTLARSGCDISEVECSILKQRLRQIALLVVDRMMPLGVFDSFGEFCLLSYREIQILRCVADGGTSKIIARALSISSDTVNFHLKNIFQKLGVCNKAQAAAYAAIHGLI